MSPVQEVSDPKTASPAITICLVGMPNAGKTTLMNALTGGTFTTANYPGVTVSLLRGRSKAELGPVRNIVDLPGVHSSIAPSPEEELACSVIEGKSSRVQPDAFILVIDATQLERHLKFAAFVAQQQKPVVVALTMVDLLSRIHQTVDVEKLQTALGVPVIAVDPRTGGGVRDVLAILDRSCGEPWQSNALSGLPADPASAFH